MLKLFTKYSGKEIPRGDIIVCGAGEEWIFVDFLGNDFLNVFWDGKYYEMPVSSFDARVEWCPLATA